MLANSEFIIMLNQGGTDREDLANLLQISETQMTHITNKISGVVTPKLVTEIKVTTDDNGNSVRQTVYVTKKVLNISIIHCLN